MKRLFAISILIISSLLLNSCGTMYSPALNANVNETKIVLSQNNFKIVGQVQGQADAKYICGIGGLSRAALRTNAIDDMTSNANLRGSHHRQHHHTSESQGDLSFLHQDHICGDRLYRRVLLIRHIQTF